MKSISDSKLRTLDGKFGGSKWGRPDYGGFITNEDYAQLRERLRVAEDIVKAAKELRDSGYDGPFIGEVCSNLFDSLNKYESAEAE